MLDIVGVTTVAGNCTVENGTINALKALELAGDETIPVYKGAAKALKIEDVDATYVHGSDGLGGIGFEMPKRMPEAEDAIDFLVRKVAENPGEITVVPIGALTNIALAVQKDPNFVRNVKSIVLMGGAEGRGNVTETAEFNFYKDPDAAKIVFEAGFKEIVMLGLDVTRKIVLHPCLEEFLLNEGETTTSLTSKASSSLAKLSSSCSQFKTPNSPVDKSQYPTTKKPPKSSILAI